MSVGKIKILYSHKKKMEAVSPRIKMSVINKNNARNAIVEVII